MNREIEFRVWDIKSKEYIKSKANYLIDGNGVLYFAFGYCELEILSREDYIVEFYTGRKDKNGVKLFEGDLCQDSYDEKYGGRIIFEDGAFLFVWENIVEQLSDVHESLEVIGNIWEESSK